MRLNGLGYVLLALGLLLGAGNTAADRIGSDYTAAGSGHAQAIAARIGQLDREFRHALASSEIRRKAPPRTSAGPHGAVRGSDERRFEGALSQLRSEISALDGAGAETLRSKVRILEHRIGALKSGYRAAAAAQLGAVQGAGPAKLAPDNDDCANATPIGFGTVTASTVGAGNDGEASCGASAGAPDIWYRYQAPEDGWVNFNTRGSGFDTVLSVHSACPGTPANQIACNDDAFGLNSSLSLNLTAGSEVLVRVSGYDGDAGPVSLEVSRAGAIAGNVRDDGGEPIENSIDVFAGTSEGDIPAAAAPDAQGDYLIQGLPPGDYFVTTRNFAGFVDERFDDFPCPYARGCGDGSGTPVTVAGDEVTAGVDFVLSPGGNIAGTVTDQATGEPLSGVEVDIYDSEGRFLIDVYTDQAGNYSVPGGLASGSYFARTYTDDALDYIDELYSDIPCPESCGVRDGTPISVTAPEETAGIDFALATGGSISGRVTDEATGQPLFDYRVAVYDSQGRYSGDGYTDETGAYRIIGLPSGSYAVFTQDNQGYVDELYDNLPCLPDCTDITGGTPVSVTAPEETAGIDFALARGGSISGRVTDEATGQPLVDVWVRIYDSLSNFARDAYTDETGAYRATGLPDGSYFAIAYSGSQGYLDELYADMPCFPSCNPGDGTPITVTAPGERVGIDFALARGGSISGTVTDEATGQPLFNVLVEIYDSQGAYVTDTRSNETGAYRSAALPIGSYFAATYNSLGYLDELYDDMPCVPYSCQITSGTPITVTAPGETAGIDFALAPGGRISGTVTDEATGEPLSGVGVDVYDSQGNYLKSGSSDNTGSYTVTGLPGGSFFAITSEYTRRYLDELYDDVLCVPSCFGFEGGTPIAVAVSEETAGIDFALALGGSISGTVTDEATGQPLSGVFFVTYDSQSRFLGTVESDETGAYRVTGLPTGSYLVLTDNSLGYLDELYDDILCEPYCQATYGMPITVTAPQDTAGIDFALAKGGTISGRVTDEATGQPLSGVYLEIYDTRGNSVDSVFSDGDGVYAAAGLSTGSYFVRTIAGVSFVSEIYDDLVCLDCFFNRGNGTRGTPVPVTAPEETPGIDFALAHAGAIAGVVIEAATGTPLSDIEVDVFDHGGRRAGRAFTNSQGRYAVGGLAAGTYFARTVETLTLDNQLFRNLACFGRGCDPTKGTPIQVTPDETTTGVHFALVPIVSVTEIHAAIAPEAHAVRTGGTALFYATVMNAGSELARDCQVWPLTEVPAEFFFQTVDPVSQALTGTVNVGADIEAGALQSFAFGFAPDAPFDPTNVQLAFRCQNTLAAPAGAFNTPLLSAHEAAVADPVVVAVTPTMDGVARIPALGAYGVFAAAVVNLGAGAELTLAVETGEAFIPVEALICETDPASGVCLSDLAGSVTTQIAAAAMPTFGVLVQAQGAIPFAPRSNRLFLVVRNGAGEVLGRASVAVTTD